MKKVFKQVTTTFKNKDLVGPYDGTSTIVDYTVCATNEKGELLFIYIKDFFKGIREFGDCFEKAKYNSAPRNSGLITVDRVFGYAPRDIIRGHPARLTTIHREQPDVGLFFVKLSVLISNHFLSYKEGKLHKETLENNILNDYVMPSSIFTSGVLNWNNQLSYHYDSANLAGTWGALATYRNDNGLEGILHLPEYGLYIKNQSNSLLIFNNKETLHAVTPINNKNNRYTAAFYCMGALKNALPPEKELLHFNNLQTKKYK